MQLKIIVIIINNIIIIFHNLSEIYQDMFFESVKRQKMKEIETETEELFMQLTLLLDPGSDLLNKKDKKNNNRNEMSNSSDNNRRCKRTASKIAIVKDGIEKQSKFWICDDCFNEKMYNNQLFIVDLIQVVELNI